MALAGLLGLGLAAGCGGDSDDDGSASAPTISAAATQPDPVTDGEPAAPATTEAEAPIGPGDAGAGAQMFVTACGGCHADGGRRAGYGPQLAGKSLLEPEIRTIVMNGRPPMPAGLVSGQDFEDVVAYVVSLQ